MKVIVPLKVKVSVTQLRLTLCNPRNCSPTGSSVHRILHSRILVWVAIPVSRGSSQPKDWTQVSFIAGRFFTVWVTGKPIQAYWSGLPFPTPGDLPDPWIEPPSSVLFESLQAESLLSQNYQTVKIRLWHFFHKMFVNILKQKIEKQITNKLIIKQTFVTHWISARLVKWVISFKTQDNAMELAILTTWSFKLKKWNPGDVQ